MYVRMYANQNEVCNSYIANSYVYAYVRVYDKNVLESLVNGLLAIILLGLIIITFDSFHVHQQQMTQTKYDLAYTS